MRIEVGDPKRPSNNPVQGKEPSVIRATGTALGSREGTLRGYIRVIANVRAITTLIGLVGIAIVFHLLTKGILISPRNIVNLTRQISITGILAVGMTFILVAGDIDLSVASGVALITVAVSIPQVWWNWGVLPSVLIALIIGVSMGAWQGYWVVKRKIPAFIVTLAGMSAYRGIALLWSKGQGIAPTKQAFNRLAHGYVSPQLTGIILLAVFAVYIVLMLNSRRNKSKYGYKSGSLLVEIVKAAVVLGGLYVIYFISFSYEGFPMPGVVLALVALFGGFVARRTTFGRSLYAIGGNKEAARLSGIKVNLIVFLNFIIMGVLTTVAGLVLTARLQSGSGVVGEGLELDAIASCIIGGTSLSGGVGTVSAAILGAAIMGVIDNGMSLMGLSAYYKMIIKGLVVLLAVFLDLYMRDRQKMVRRR
jgi:D-xylose transport system permease protein